MQRKNPHGKEEKLCDTSRFRVGIVAARFNREITDALLENALAECAALGVKRKNVTVVRVPGAIELPLALGILARQKKYHALTALGAVIRGETPHFDYVCKVACEGILRVMLDHNLPVGFGVLTTLNEKQAKARFHVGREAARAALELACLKKSKK